MTVEHTPIIPRTAVRFPNGISLSTGRPLQDEFSMASLEETPKESMLTQEEEQVSAGKHTAAKDHLGPIAGVEGDDLAQAGWGILFSAAAAAEQVEAILDALAPLIRHRQHEAKLEGFPYEKWKPISIFRGSQGYQTGESCRDWLARQRVSMAPVDPRLGVPYYLLLIGSPDQIPYEFQYTLDIYWGIGRLSFDSPEEYRRYADNVVRYETGDLLRTERTVAVFATRHEFDNATKLFHDEVAAPLIQGDQNHKPLGADEGFEVRHFLAESATKSTLIDLMAGTHKQSRPALLFTGSHGLAVDKWDEQQRDFQGALICQDWKTLGHIESGDWMSAADIPEQADALGLVHFSFACYSAGTPQFDDYNWSYPKKQKRIAAEAFVAKLPQKLLLQGALASCGHIDRAWAHSFYVDKAGGQIQGFRDVLTGLLRGKRIGMAMDQFNTRWATLSVELAETLEAVNNGKKIPAHQLTNLWIARNDARNYVVLGDPAVRLRVQDIQSPQRFGLSG